MIMSDIFSLYPRISTDTSADIFNIQPFALSYIDEDNATCPLELKSTDARGNRYFIEDPDGIWMHDSYGFKVEGKVCIGDPSSLFGLNKNSIACAGSTLGLAFQWSSKTSSRKSTKEIGSFTKSDKNKEFVISEEFKKGEIRGELNFSIILYLKTPGAPHNGEELFINQPGYLLGELDSITVQIDGNGSILPVFYEDVRGAALWRVICDLEDPATDEFSDQEKVSIIINRKNPNFKFIDKKNELFNPQMANEVMSAAISMIIETFRANDPSFETLNNPGIGSVASAVKYFRDKLNWDLTSPISVNMSIRAAFENKQ